MQSADSETRTFYIELYARIEVQQSDFPDGKVGAALVDKVRKKVMCHREDHTIVELKLNEYEGAINRGEDEED